MDSPDQALSLKKAGRYYDALQVMDRVSDIGAPIQFLVMKAELSELVGDHSKARHLAERVLRANRVTAGQRAACENVMGRVFLENGEAFRAIEHLQRALALSHKSGDLTLLCSIQSKLVSVVAERSGRDAAAPLLADLRRNITRLGDGDTTAQAHMFVAEMEGRQGHLNAARRHVLLGQQLLGDKPNLWLAAFAENVLLAISILEGRISEARTHSERALEFSESSGAASARRSAAANTGNLLFLCGDFEKAFECFERALAFLPSHGERNNGILEALAHIRLSQGRLDDCQSFLDQIEATIRDESDRAFYGHRYAELTTARLFAKRDRFDEALRRIELVLKLASQTGDKLLETAALLDKATWLHRTGRWPDCAVALRLAIRDTPTSSPDVLAVYNAVIASALVDQGRLEAACSYQGRANRIFKLVPNAPRSIEFQREPLDSGEPIACTPANSEAFQAGARAAIQSLAVALAQTSRPEVVGAELAQTFVEAGCANAATVVEIGSDRSHRIVHTVSGGASSPERRFVVGDLERRKIELVVTPKEGIEPESTLNLLASLIEKLRELQLSAIEKERRAVLWPIEIQAGDSQRAVISGHMRELMSFAQRVARTTVNVMLTGESGTGKEILARAIHDFSDRAQKPFLPLNCAAVPRELLESQLFGHRRGAFTGAERDQLGLIRSADGGTLFLDEVGEMSLELQPKLLRFLESGEIAPLGEPAPLTVKVRVIAATNANLEDAVRDGRFREDLFYRLNVVRLAIKPLRERRDEIPGLVNHFVAEAAREYKKGYLQVAEETMERLLLYRWPGNVRQLHNEIRRMVALAEPDTTLDPDAISADILGALPLLRQPAITGREAVVPLHEKLAPTLSRIEYEMIKAALRENHGRLEPAAKALGISRKGLYLKRQRLGL